MQRAVLGCLYVILAAGSVSKYEIEEYESLADARAIVVAGNARFTVLSSAMVRMEYSNDTEGGNVMFEDRASLAVVNRKLPVPEFKTYENDTAVFIETEELKLTYIKNQPFSPETLRVDSLDDNSAFESWTYGMDSTTDDGNLFGTFRTLDGQNNVQLNCTTNGKDHCEFGLTSRSGWALINDHGVPVLDENDFWADENGVMLKNQDVVDIYLLAPGRDYKRALYDYQSIGGSVPIVPRYALGAWFTRWYNFELADVKRIVEEYKQHGLPLDVFTLDMNWHTKNDWTGYSWDQNLFKYPEHLMAYLKDVNGLAVAANLHDANGINSWETGYQEACDFLKLNASKGDRIQLDLANRQYTTALDDIILRPKEKTGMDFWWIDWQQGENRGNTGQAEREKMNPTIWLDKMRVTDPIRRCVDSGDCTNKRGMVLARFGGLGNHRYQVGFSGDVKKLSWSNLAYQPYFTLTAANVAYGYWSHDIVGPGNDPEMYTRWIQWATVSPVMRSHDRGGSAGDCASWPNDFPPNRGCWIVRPWLVPDKYAKVVRSALQNRAKLTPYFYTLSRMAFETGISPLRPMYYDFPEEDMAYKSQEDGSFPQYMLGPSILVRPVVAQMDGNSQLAENQELWVPPGLWIEKFTHKVMKGPSVESMTYSLEEIPMYVKPGSVIPETVFTQGEIGQAKRNPKTLVFSIYPGEQTGNVSVYEDDGASYDYLKKAYAWTTLSYTRNEYGVNVTISMEGDFKDSSPRDNVIIRLVGSPPLKVVSLNEKGLKSSIVGGIGSYSYDGPELTSVVETGPVDASKGAVSLTTSFAYPEDDWTAFSGYKGMIRKAGMAKYVLDEQRKVPGESQTISDNLSQVAGTGEDLSYLATGKGGGIDEFQKRISAISSQYKSASDEVNGLSGVQDGRKQYAVNLLKTLLDV